MLRVTELPDPGPSNLTGHPSRNGGIQSPMKERGKRKEVQGILLCDLPCDLRRMGCDVPECPEHALQQVHQSRVLAPLSLRLQGIEREPRQSVV